MECPSDGEEVLQEHEPKEQEGMGGVPLTVVPQVEE